MSYKKVTIILQTNEPDGVIYDEVEDALIDQFDGVEIVKIEDLEEEE